MNDLEFINDINDTSEMKVVNRDTVPYIEMTGFTAPGIRHGFSTRLGGVSVGIFRSLNLATNLDDDRESVMENYRRIGKSIGIDSSRISCPNQVHKTNILIAEEKDAGDGITRSLTHFEIDAQITNVKNLPLIVFGADCVPLLFHDPVNGVIASAHAGWRGTTLGIAGKVIRKMAELYGSDPSDIKVAIGPSIGIENYEVDKTVIDAIDAAIVDAAQRSDIYYEKTNGKYQLSLWNANTALLMADGVLREHIYCSGLCTMKYHDVFFSHRFTNGKRGLNAGIISLI